VRSSLTLLAALGAALALAGPGGMRESASGTGEPDLDPNVALEIRAAGPAVALPDALRRLAASTSSPTLARAIRSGLSAPSRAGLGLERLLAPFSYVVLSIERSCPPPAVLACHPAVRFTGRLRGRTPPGLERELRAVLLAELGEAGFEALHARRSRDGAELAGRVGSRGETLARWRLDDRVLEVVTGGLAPRAGAAGVGGSAALPETPAGSTPAVLIDVNASLLASLGGDTSP
jgi:hypothetical protein